MDILKKYLPHAFKVKDVNSLIVALLIYIVIDIVCGFVIGLLAKLPIIGIVFGLGGSLVGLYALLGIVLSILVFLKIVK